MSAGFVAIIMGSDSDLPVMQVCADALNKFNISHELRISSAHRTPDDTREYVRDAEQRGCQVFVAGAGMAAHLAGAIAAHTTKPVIGVPIDAGPMQGVDALLSTVQMPGGVPVACVAIGRAGAKNAAYLAAQIIAVADEQLNAALLEDRSETAESIRAKNEQLNTSD